MNARAQGSPTNIPDITGSWERARDASIPAQPQPPLKAQYLKDWQARQQAAREASAKGKPIAERVVMCLPDGMPGMMSGPFPMEVLQSKERKANICQNGPDFGGQTTIYTQTPVNGSPGYTTSPAFDPQLHSFPANSFSAGKYYVAQQCNEVMMLAFRPLATHGYMNPYRGLDSGIVLALPRARNEESAVTSPSPAGPPLNSNSNSEVRSLPGSSSSSSTRTISDLNPEPRTLNPSRPTPAAPTYPWRRSGLPRWCTWRRRCRERPSCCRASGRWLSRLRRRRSSRRGSGGGRGRRRTCSSCP